MNRNLIIGIVVVVLVVIAGWFLLQNQLMPATNTQTMEASPATDDAMMQSSPQGVMESTDSAAEGMEGAIKEFKITGSNFKFDVPEIRVNEGDTVKITFTNSQGFHDFVIDEFNVATKQTQGPSEETVTFVADKAGTYEFYCSVGQHRAMGMKGNLVVE